MTNTLTTMNFDLITKLAKLANNNPNENEANLAARKVCRLLAEGEFQFAAPQQSNTPPQREPNRPPPYRRPSTNDPFRGGFDFDFGDIFSDFYKRSGRRPFEDFKEGAWKNPFEEETKKETTHTYQCSKCGHHKTTEFRGPASEFMCMDCRGKENFEQDGKKQRKCIYCGVTSGTRVSENFVCASCNKRNYNKDFNPQERHCIQCGNKHMTRMKNFICNKCHLENKRKGGSWK